MRVATITSTEWLAREMAAHHRLADGLVEQGVETIHVVPERVPLVDGERGERATWPESGWHWLDNARVTGLADRLSESEAAILYAPDAGLWPGALKLAHRLNVPIILAVWSAADIDRLHVPLIAKTSSGVAVTAPTQPMLDAVAKKIGDRAATLLVRPGIRTMREPASAAHSETFCAAICGDGRLNEDYQSLFEAIHRVIEQKPQAQFFLDAGGARQHAQWQAARQRGLLTNLNFVPRWLGHAELLLTTDVLIQPQSLGQVRTLTLQAMAQGMPVIAAGDPWLDYLVRDRTAWLMDENPKPADWVRMIERVTDEPSAARELGQRAREWVLANCGPAEQAAQLAGLIRRLVGQAIKFGAPTA